MKIRSGVFIIGLFLIIVLCGVTAYNNYFLQNSKLSGNHLPVGSILALFFLAIFINVPLKKFANHLALSSTELIVIWVMLIVTLGIPSMGFLQFLLPTLVAIFYFATPETIGQKRYITTFQSGWSSLTETQLETFMKVWIKADPFLGQFG